MCVIRGHLRELIFPLYKFEDQARIIRFGGKHPHVLSRLDSLIQFLTAENDMMNIIKCMHLKATSNRHRLD